MGNEEAIMPYPNWAASTDNCDTGPYQGTPDGDRFCPAHCDMVLREHIWFWQEDPPPITNITQMVSMYLTSIGRGCLISSSNNNAVLFGALSNIKLQHHLFLKNIFRLKSYSIVVFFV